MKPKLSIAIPVYNFANFLPETLDSILDQNEVNEIEIVILDGASTDETPSLIASYKKRFTNLKYIRRSVRGGIDRDMAEAVASSSGDYVWLFSGDDWILPGALGKLLARIDYKASLYLTRHLEWRDYEQDWVVWPTVEAEEAEVFDLSNSRARKDYFSRAQNTEAFFSFIGGIVVHRELWQSISINEVFVGSCWAHSARLFELMPRGLTVCVLNEAYLKRRPDNDSFGSAGFVARYRLTIDGFIQIVDHYYGRASIEAREIRRVLRVEYHPLAMMLGKFLCSLNPEKEDQALLDRLFDSIYGEWSLECLGARLNYMFTSPRRFRRLQPVLSAKYEKKT